MKVLIKKLGEDYKFAEIEHTTEGIWNAIGGNSQTLTLRGGLVLIKRIGEKLPSNSVVRGVRGPVVVDGDFIVAKQTEKGICDIDTFDNPNVMAATFSLHEFQIK